MATDTYLSSRRREGRDECVWFDAQGIIKAAMPLPRRGHSFAFDKASGRAVVFGRQPGFFAKAFQLNGAAWQAQELPLPDGHHFYGHGVFSADGEYLYVTENDYCQVRGVVGVYDARPGKAWRREGEFDTGGIGPHELVLMPDGSSLCVANGGMETHPDYGKSILNAATMQASLAYLDSGSGKLLELRTLPEEWRQLSIRHLAVDGGGRVWAGCQYPNPDGRRPSLVLRHRRGEALQALSCPPAQWRAMRNYVGSVTPNGSGTVIATSSPLGGRVMFWGAESGSLLDAVALPDVCGVAPYGDDGFLLSSGHGVLAWHQPGVHGVCEDTEEAQGVCPAPSVPEQQSIRHELSWDNHMRRI